MSNQEPKFLGIASKIHRQINKIDPEEGGGEERRWHIPSKRRRTEGNLPARVALIGLPRSRGSKTGVRTGAMAEGEAKSEGGNPSRDLRTRFMARTTSSPALGAKVPAKHQASLRREGSPGWRSESAQEEAGEICE